MSGLTFALGQWLTSDEVAELHAEIDERNAYRVSADPVEADGLAWDDDDDEVQR